MDEALDMLHLFEGRMDAYGGNEGRAIYRPVDVALIHRHLEGVEPIGIYPIRFLDSESSGEMDAMVVKWGCCDIDTGDWAEAYALVTALKAMGLKPWVERSRSKGWHVWVFADTWVPAYVMRRCLKMAYKAIDLPAKEANPKSELLKPNQLGNYVRLPYPGALNRQAPERQTMVVGYDRASDGKVLKLSDFLAVQASELLTPHRTITAWAQRWYEPRKKVIVRPDLYDETLESIVNGLPRGLRTLFHEGPRQKEGAPKPDTSQGLMALAHNMAQKGYHINDVYAVVEAADRRWGKFHMRNNPETYLSDIVERAFK